MKTIKQIADELGIDKQRVYRYIKQNRIKESHQDSITMYYDTEAENLIKSHFHNIIKSDETHQSTLNAPNDAIIDVLKETINTLQGQLDVKDKQIAELTEALVNTTKSLETSHKLHAGTIHNQKQLTGFSIENAEASAEDAPTVTKEPDTPRFIDRLKQLFK